MQKSLQKPSFITRLYALLVDYVIILGYMCVLAVVSFTVYLFAGEIPNWLEYGVVTAELLGFLVLVLPVGLYLYLSESSARQATIGKRIAGLVVVSNRTGDRPSNSQIAVRTIVKLLPWELAHFFVWHAAAATQSGQDAFPLWLTGGLLSSSLLPIIYILIVAFQQRARGPHDLVARTRVISMKTRNGR